ncbi:hypothetical protein JCM10207_006160 [Rhodosporidiobolus poonsookiae]
MGYSDSDPSHRYPPSSPPSSSRAASLASSLDPHRLSPEPLYTADYPHSRPLTPRRTRWFAQTRTWIALSAFLAMLVVLLGGGTAHPAVRSYVGDRVDRVTGLTVPLKEGNEVAKAEGEEDKWTEEGFWDDVRAGRKANGTLVLLVNPHSNLFHALLPTLNNIEARFNRRLGYPIQLLTDGDLPSEAIQRRTEYITGGKAKWALVTRAEGWGPPPSVSAADVKKGQDKIKGFPVGYRNMCRFFSRFHHLHPSLEGFEYIWRLDEGIQFFCELMTRSSLLYGYTNTDTEAPFVIPTLWSTTQDFMRRAKEDHPEWFPEDRDEAFVLTDDGKGEYNRRMYYNNFEIVHRSFLSSPAYQSYTQHLDDAKGFYLERWGDAPVRTIGLSFFAPKDKVVSFSNVTGYKHDSPPFECPDEPWCFCDPSKSRENAFDEWRP